MNLSMKWLNDYVKVDMPIKEFAAEMTMSGSKVETYESVSGPIKNIFLGKVTKMEKHTDSEKLWVCQVDFGSFTKQIVTAAQNVFEGALLPVVLDGGVVIDHKTKGVVEIKNGELRGVLSEGMMCSYEELGMEKADFPYADENGVLIFNEDAEISAMPLGTPIEKAVGIDDISVEFEITNNRPDCLSVLGLARETSATFSLPLNIKEPSFKGQNGNINEHVSVEVKNPKLCSRYMAGMVKNVKIAPSPRWLAERLRASGVRSINNLVDITNFVMLEYGHPMHAFDLRYLDGGKITVRNAENGEKITLLDDTEVTLSEEMLVICDEKKPVAVAGVMGGQFSSVMNDSTTIVFESACFDGTSVRRTAKKIGVRTESSSRFEKGLPAQNAKDALYRALELVELLECGEVVGGIIDVDNSDKTVKRLKHDYNWINKFLGSDISNEEQIDILKRLGFGYENGEVIVPYTRIDMNLPCDIAEEIARIYGYNKIQTTIPRLLSSGKSTPEQDFERKLIDIMLSQGCYETMSYSFISPKSYDRALVDESLKNSIKIRRPLGEDTSVMRTTLVPSMLEIVSRNFKNRTLAGRFFEIGREYHPTGENALPKEKDVLCVTLYGATEDFYSIKGIAEELLSQTNVKADFIPLRSNTSYHSGRCAEIISDGVVIGTVGEIHPLAAQNYDINARVYMAEIDIDRLFKASYNDIKYEAIPKFPAVTRDLSLVCDESVTNGEIIDIISENANYLEQVSFFDIYRGEQVASGKKSISYKLMLRSRDKTMTDAEADEVIQNVLKALEAKNITLRQ